MLIQEVCNPILTNICTVGPKADPSDQICMGLDLSQDLREASVSRFKEEVGEGSFFARSKILLLFTSFLMASASIVPINNCSPLIFDVKCFGNGASPPS